MFNAFCFRRDKELRLDTKLIIRSGRIFKNEEKAASKFGNKIPLPFSAEEIFRSNLTVNLRQKRTKIVWKKLQSRSKRFSEHFSLASL